MGAGLRCYSRSLALRKRCGGWGRHADVMALERKRAAQTDRPFVKREKGVN